MLNESDCCRRNPQTHSDTGSAPGDGNSMCFAQSTFTRVPVQSFFTTLVDCDLLGPCSVSVTCEWEE